MLLTVGPRFTEADQASVTFSCVETAQTIRDEVQLEPVPPDGWLFVLEAGAEFRHEDSRSKLPVLVECAAIDVTHARALGAPGSGPSQIKVKGEGLGLAVHEEDRK